MPSVMAMSTLEKALVKTPFTTMSRNRRANDLAVFAYHGVDDPNSFVKHLDYVTEHMHPIGLDQLEASFSGEPLPERAVLFTFDDGGRTVLTEAAPLLQERNIPAVCFVVSALIGTDEVFWWDEVAALAPEGTADTLVRELKAIPNHERLRRIEHLRAENPSVRPRRRQLDRADLFKLIDAGIAIGNHTHTHPCLDRCSDSEIAHEIASSHDLLTDALGEPCRWFAYPNGNLDRRAEGALTDRGYAGAFLFDHQFSKNPPLRPMRISRLRVNATTPMHRFELIVSGVHPRLHRLRGRR